MSWEEEFIAVNEWPNKGEEVDGKQAETTRVPDGFVWLRNEEGRDIFIRHKEISTVTPVPDDVRDPQSSVSRSRVLVGTVESVVMGAPEDIWRAMDESSEYTLRDALDMIHDEIEEIKQNLWVPGKK